MKENDWIVANLNNPNFTSDLFQTDLGMNLENTLLLPKEEYKKSLLIKDTFKNNDGSFNEKAFDNFYTNLLSKFNDFATLLSLSNYEYSLWDTNNVGNLNKRKDPNFKFISVPNPDRISTGIAGRNVEGERTKSASELALTQQIWDPETNQFLDITPNDNSLFSHPINYIKSLFDDPLVIATWDEAGEHVDPITGKLVKHEKGERKLNDKGTYYAEKLNGRSLVGKQVISALDILTVDGEGINKYDFFDSDGLDKDITGTITKNLLAIAPLAFFGPVGSAIYGGLYVTRELAKALPMLYGMASLITGNTKDSKFLNTVAGYGAKFSGSTSEYALEHAFSFENFGNLISDVALLWSLQKAIALALLKLLGTDKIASAAQNNALGMYIDKVKGSYAASITGLLGESQALTLVGLENFSSEAIEAAIKSGKWMESAVGKLCLRKFMDPAKKVIESRTKLGQDLSLAYMAIISNTDVYDSALEHGANKKEAAWLALGTTLGMFGVDKYTGLGEIFWDNELALERKLYRELLRKEGGEITDSLIGNANKGIQGLGKITKLTTESEEKRWFTRWFKTGMNKSRDFIDKYMLDVKDHTLGFVGKAVGEGLEEVSEELVTDLGKQLFEIAGDLGYVSQKDFGAWDDWQTRYAMSFFGGAIGGGLFYGVDAFRNQNSFDAKKNLHELAYLIANGKKEDIMLLLTKLHKKGKLGSTTLSVITEKDEKDSYFVTADTNHLSQNDYVYNILTSSINLLDNIINENQMNLSEPQLFDKMVLSDIRYLNLKDYLMDASYVTGYLEKFRDLTLKIYKTSEDLAKATKTIDGTVNGLIVNDSYHRADLATYDANILAIRDGLSKLYEERDKFLNGEYSVHYIDKMGFAIDTGLNEPFIAMTFGLWIRNNKHKSYNELTELEKTAYTQEYTTYKQTNQKRDLDEAFKIYTEMRKKLTPLMLLLSEADLTSWKLVVEKMAKSYPTTQLKNWNSKLDGETDEVYLNRNTQLEGESEEAYESRKALRLKIINDYNNNNLVRFILEFANINGFIDTSTYRKFLADINLRKSDRVRDYYTQIANQTNGFGIPGLEATIMENLKNLKEDFSNIKEIKNSITEILLNAAFNYFERTETFSDYIFDALYGEDGVDYEYVTNAEVFKNLFESKFPGEDLTAADEEKIHNLLESEAFAPYEKDIVSKIYSKYLEYKSLEKLRLELAAASVENEELNNKIKNILNSAASFNRANYQNQAKMYADLEASRFGELLDNTIQIIQNDDWIKALDSVKAKVDSQANPTLFIIKAVASQLGTEPINIESLLDRVRNEYEGADKAVEFQLTPLELELLNLAKELLAFALAFVYGASTTSNYTNPVGHNKSINEFLRAHKPKLLNALGLLVNVTVDELPEMDDNHAQIYINEFLRYNNEIDRWIKRSMDNQMNKKLKFKEADTAFIKTRLELFETNKEAFKTKSGINLLEGYDALTLNNDALSIYNVEKLLHTNVKKLINILKSKGKTEDEIYNELFSIFNNGIVILDLVKEQITSNLDASLEYSNFTLYDRWAYIIGIMGLNPKVFQSTLKLFILENDTIAPLSILEYVGKMTLVLLMNPTIINLALDWLKTKLNLKLGLIYNSTFVSGIGGAGKTDVVAKMGAKLTNDEIWTCGPTSELANKLQTSIGKGIAKDRGSIMKEILGDDNWSKLKNSYDKGANDLYQTFKAGIDSSPVNKLLPKLTNLLISFTKAPKLIIIDEATHFSNIELLLLGLWAKLNGSNILFLGDEGQIGFKLGSIHNIQREMSLIWRTPRLNISLRDSNILKNGNLNEIISISNYIRNSGDLGESGVTQLLLRVLKLSLAYYDDTIYGDKIVNLVTDEDLLKIDKALKTKYNEDASKGTIGIITDSGEANDLVNRLSNLTGAQVKVLNVALALGQEFDYTIIDKTWELDKEKPTALKILNFLLDLYTMISRSRDGSLIINKHLTEIIKPSIELNVTMNPADTIKEAALEFLAEHLAIIELLLNNDSENIEESTLELSSKSKEEKTDEEEIKSQEDKDLPKEEELDNSLDRKDEVKIAKIETYDLSSINTPVRIYSNFHIVGTTVKEIDGKKIWINDGLLRDCGNFMKTNEVSSGEQKRHIVDLTLLVKSLLTYGTDIWDSTDSTVAPEIRDLFDKSSFEKVNYYVEVADPDISKGYLLMGETTLELNKIAVKGKVLSIVAELKDKRGRIRKFTLGALPNPDTWYDNKPKIRAAITARIAELKSDPQSDQALISNLLEYVNTLDFLVEEYTKWVDELTKKNLNIEIETPEFSGLTTLIPLDESIRLEELDSNKSEWDLHTQHAVTSDIMIYGIKEDSLLPGLPENLKGKAVVYVSSNTLLRPSELESLYRKLRLDMADGKPSKGLVRMIVLDNVGVSFRSLYTHYNDLYLTVAANGKMNLFPFELEAQGIKMYLAAWNYRAELKKFNNKVSEFEQTLSAKGIDLLELLILDNSIFLELRNKFGEDKLTSPKYTHKILSERKYRELVTSEKPELIDKLKTLWDFNDQLLYSVRYFRLGTDKDHGVYARLLSNLESGGLYDKLEGIWGTYINPIISRLLEKMIDNLFTEVLNKLVPPPLNIEITSWLDLNKEPGWFKTLVNAAKQHEIKVNIINESNPEHTLELTLSMPNSEHIKRLPILLVQIAKYMEIRAHNIAKFNLHYNIAENPDAEPGDALYGITIGDEPLDYIKLFNSALEEGLLDDVDPDGYPRWELLHPDKLLGVKVLKDKEGNIVGVYDARIDDFFSLMFHGAVWARSSNDFENNAPRCYFSPFKFGIKVDPMMVPRKDNDNAKVSTNRKFFKTNVVCGFPIGLIRPKKKITEISVKPAKMTLDEFKYINGKRFGKLSGDRYSYIPKSSFTWIYDHAQNFNGLLRNNEITIFKKAVLELIDLGFIPELNLDWTTEFITTKDWNNIVNTLTTMGYTNLIDVYNNFINSLTINNISSAILKAIEITGDSNFINFLGSIEDLVEAVNISLQENKTNYLTRPTMTIVNTSEFVTQISWDETNNSFIKKTLKDEEPFTNIDTLQWKGKLLIGVNKDSEFNVVIGPDGVDITEILKEKTKVPQENNNIIIRNAIDFTNNRLEEYSNNLGNDDIDTEEIERVKQVIANSLQGMDSLDSQINAKKDYPIRINKAMEILKNEGILTDETPQLREILTELKKTECTLIM